MRKSTGTLMTHIRNGDEFWSSGFKFIYKTEPDHDHGPPWESDCGAGIVSEQRYERNPHLTKRPGERLLFSDRVGYYRFYDWQATMRKARKERWDISYRSAVSWSKLSHNAKPEFEWRLWHAGLTVGQRAELAVEEDFERMRSWCNDQWGYIGVVVKHVRTGIEQSLWGIENDGDYKFEVAIELAGEIIHEVRRSHQDKK